MVRGSKGQWGKDKLKRTRDDIDELCKKYTWLGEVDDKKVTEAA